MAEDAILTRSEKDLGIECFLTQGNTIEAILKYRYQDFIVNEISADKKVVVLDKSSAISSSTVDNEPWRQKTKFAHDQEFKRVSDEDLDELQTLIGQDLGEKMKKFYEDYYNGDKNL